MCFGSREPDCGSHHTPAPPPPAPPAPAPVMGQRAGS